MCDYAIAGDARFGLSRIEIDKAGPSYTAETLRSIRSQEPDAQLFLILGGDQAAALPDWHEPEAVLELATVAVVERINWSKNAIGIKVVRLRGGQSIRYLEMPIIQISSSAIRRRAGEGKPIRYLVPGKVASYIESNGLYGASVSEGAPA
jgi:nicotinate-nucleotide adenylyltransferase